MEAEEAEDAVPSMPPRSTTSWTIDTIKAHTLYSTYLQYMRDENEDQQWEMEAEEDIDMWLEWLADNEEAAIPKEAAITATCLRGCTVDRGWLVLRCAYACAHHTQATGGT